MVKEKKDKKMHGRKIAAWKIVTMSVLALLAAAAVCVYVYFATYVPDVTKDPQHEASNTSSVFSLNYNAGVKRYNVPSALSRLGETIKKQLKRVPVKDAQRREGVYNFLVLGHDKVALNTDVIMVVNFDTESGSLSIMQLPRDTYIEHGAYSHKVNSMLAFLVNEARKEGASDVYGTALNRFSEILEDALSIEIDNYALVNLEAFSSIVDIVGGVPIDVPEAMHYDDIYQDLHIHIEAGQQVLDGEDAMGFVRYRAGYLQADIGRLNAQKMFMTAFVKRVKESISVNTVTKMVDQVIKNVTTDISLSDAVYFAKAALSLDLGNMNMVTLPGEAVNSGLSYYVIYRDSTLALVNDYFNVYDTDITDEMFDKDLLFTDGDSTKIDSVYRRQNTEYVVNNGESVSENGIYIPRYYGKSEDDDTTEETSANVYTGPSDTNENTDSTDVTTDVIDTPDTSLDVSDSDDIESSGDIESSEDTSVDESGVESEFESDIAESDVDESDTYELEDDELTGDDDESSDDIDDGENDDTKLDRSTDMTDTSNEDI